jgi:aspartyl-tRNA synthetase
MSEAATATLREQVLAEPGGAIFLVCDTPAAAARLAGRARTKLSEDLKLVDTGKFEFCWIVDFPMYQLDETTGKIDFAHNPFSMPQGGLDALNTTNPLDIKAYQYDIVCNGHELGSGAVRNHVPEIMLRAFEIVGYPRHEVEDKFSGLLTALKAGAPPHAGCAPGVDRMVMLLADEMNLRQVIAFPMNQQQQDLLMHAPNTVPPERLRELHIRMLPPEKKP